MRGKWGMVSINSKNKINSILIGFTANAVFLIFYAFIYQTFLVEFVSKSYTFFGTIYFFVLVALLVPVLFLLLKKYYECIGAIMGILGYFCIFIPLAMSLS